ncbi:MAG: hypothetical protein ABJM06_04760 [Gilvibacter sp.]
MRRIKIGKYSLVVLMLLILGGGLYYLQLSNRHKAIVKTTLAHRLGLVDNSWNITYLPDQTQFVTPTFVVDNIYTSMEGPKVMQGFQVNPNSEDLIWIQSFKTEALAIDEQTVLSNDYICHTNVDYYDSTYYSKWNLPDRIGQHYPRLATLTNGMESYEFPEGFGFPIKANEYFYLSTQSLNHNKRDSVFKLKHKITLGYAKDDSRLKPLDSRTIFIMLPYDDEQPFKNDAAKVDPSICIPVETKNHNYLASNGRRMSGHWVIFPGKQTYRSLVNDQLQLKDTTRLHHIATHLHPFAESLSLKDITADTIIFKALAINHQDKIGLEKIAEFTSEEGVLLYPDHDYQLVLQTNNTSDSRQDMMASMFVALYDSELDKKIKESRSRD